MGNGEAEVSIQTPPANRPRIAAAYWLADQPLINFGDLITEVLLQAMGYEVVNAMSEEGRRFESCLMAVGSILDRGWIEQLPQRKVVWGSGYWGDEGLTARHVAACDFRCVRGPLTCRLLGLPESLPLGDPALLLPRYFPMDAVTQAATTCSVITVPHCFQYPPLHRRFLRAEAPSDRERAATLGAEEVLHTVIRREQFHGLLMRIATARFVLTSSLHAAIVAQAYGVPWAIALLPGEGLNKPIKWLDWLEYLGIEKSFQTVQNLEAAQAWWDRAGCRGRVQDMDQLLRSFPRDLVSAPPACL